jgi:hypothetical protein
MRSLTRSIALAGALALGALALSAQGAAAYVACNGEGACWHADRHYRAPGVAWHPDNWYFHQNLDKDHWMGHHEGRGYYRGGVWIGL